MPRRGTQALERARCTLTTTYKLRIATGMAVLAAVCWAQQAGRGGPPQIPGQNRNGMHIYIWGGLKTHNEGQHDYPQFLADWSKLLTTRGAVVDGSLHAPTAAELANTDVVVIYKG